MVVVSAESVLRIRNSCQAVHERYRMMGPRSRVGCANFVCYVLCSVTRPVFNCWVLLIALLAGCGRNQRMDAVYEQRCFNCHGANGHGDGPMAAALPVAPPDFRDTVERKSNPQIRRLIADGKGLMPAFEPALSASEINDMLQMVRFLSREGRQIAGSASWR